MGAAAVSSLQQYNFTKAFMGANGVALEAGFTTPDPEEAAVKATVGHRARESWQAGFWWMTPSLRASARR